MNLSKAYERNFNFKGIYGGVIFFPYQVAFGMSLEWLNEQKIDEFSLVQKSRELDFQYCFKIQNNPKDLKEIINTVSKDMILKFKLLNPELFEHAKTHGFDFDD